MRPHRRQPTRFPRPWDSPGKNTGVGCHFLLQCVKVKSESEVAQLCPTLSDPMDCSLPGSSIHGIFQAKVLEWGAIAFSLQLMKSTPLAVHSSCSSLPHPNISYNKIYFCNKSKNKQTNCAWGVETEADKIMKLGRTFYYLFKKLLSPAANTYHLLQFNSLSSKSFTS